MTEKAVEIRVPLPSGLKRSIITVIVGGPKFESQQEQKVL